MFYHAIEATVESEGTASLRCDPATFITVQVFVKYDAMYVK